ncbi:MFS transporter [Actinosynnema sp. NPDC020468]|uniref:MFS transporter n=1 Tax=Actinosynnema sp. NPDC020468 TaxID=3154488 RepID=UPI0033EBF79F
MITVTKHRWVALAALLTAEAMNLLDSTVVQVVGPVVRASLGGPLSDVQWYTAAYTLAFAVLLVTGGRLGDRYGRRRVFRVGVVGFVVASVLCALAWSSGALVAWRVLQGASSALVIPQTLGLIRAAFGEEERSRALGFIGPVMGLAAVCGPVLGGVLTHAATWRAVFLVNVPLGVAVLALSVLLPEDRGAVRRLDLVGSLLVVVGAGLVVHPLIQTWDARVFGLGVLVLLVFAWHQRRWGALVERSLFARPAFPAALVTSTLLFAVVTGVLPVVVLDLELRSRVDVLDAGVAVLPWSVAMGVGSWVAGAWLVPRFGSRVMAAGAVLLGGGVVAFALGGWLPAALTLCGLGFGLFATPFFTIALAAVRPEETGSAAGLLNAVQQFGGTLGVAVLVTAYLAHGPSTAAWLAAAALLPMTAAAAVMTRPPAAAPKGTR